MVQVEHFFEVHGEALTVEQFQCTRAEWSGMDKSFLAGWSVVLCDDGMILATRLNLPAATKRLKVVRSSLN